MIVYGLTSNIPIRKEYNKDEQGQIIKTPYPFTYEFTSTEYVVEDIQSFEGVVRKVAGDGGCILKGTLARPLVAEGRAGATNPESETEWICLDLDGVQGVQSVDIFLDEIGLGGVDYVLQWSSSMGIENQVGFRCHIFMMLDKPANPQLLKNWLTNLNLTCPTLVNSLQLTKTYNSLRWPLDVTTCQNDKLIYVAPPKLGANIQDPYPLATDRIYYKKGTKPKVVLPPNVPPQTILREKIDAQVNRLRETSGIEKKKSAKYKYAGETEYLANPDTATITGTKVERGFVYLNLNGGDSWGYYHPEDNPAFIYNFKGEPVYRTEDLLPQYWAQVRQRVKDHKPDTTGKIYLAFRDLHTASYWNGTFNTNTNELDIYKANSKEQLKDYMKQHGQPLGDYIPDWVMDFDPHAQFIIDPTTRKINTYRASEYFKDPPISTPTQPPPTIHKLVSHILGGDAATIEHFYNWLAVIAQGLARTGTCWVLQGTQGTGKGMLFHKVLTPIFGSRNVVSKRVDEIESNFTSYFRNKFLVYVDEMEITRGSEWSKITAKLKNIIVEPTISIRPMYQEAVEVKNYANLIFSTNKIQGVQIEVDDRRYNVGAYQRERLDAKLSDHEIDVLLPSEVEAFSDYLRTRNADVAKARYPIDNAPRRLLQSIGQTAIDEISMNLKNGNLEYFQEYAQDPDTVGGLKKYAATKYKDLIDELSVSKRTYLTREDLQTILGWLLDSVPQTPVKFASFIKHHDMELTPRWINGKSIRVLNVSWQTGSDSEKDGSSA